MIRKFYSPLNQRIWSINRFSSKFQLRSRLSSTSPFEPHSTSFRSLWGLSFPVASNEPLAGTIDGSGPPFLFILQVFIGLPTVLWMYKCLVLVMFQRKIIYLPSVPPGTRDESLDPPTSERLGQLNGLDWKEISIESSTKSRWTRQPVILKGLELSALPNKKSTLSRVEDTSLKEEIVILYLQGNAGTPVMRIPLFRKLLISFAAKNFTQSNLKIITIAPRSYWLSTRSAPTQTSLLSDYTSFLSQTIASHSPSTKFILYGHSLGGSIALHLLHHHPKLTKRINSIILENPLPSIPYMVQSLYPQKWLPYHYLGPLAFDKWNSISILKQNQILHEKSSLWIRSGQDEIVPHDEFKGVKEMWNLSGGSKKWVEIEGALHDTAYFQAKWENEIREFIIENCCKVESK